MDVNRPPIRAAGLWFSDCGLVLQAEHTLFRISRDFMATHSPIFRDMLALPTPPDADMYDGCPLVCLPDSAEDMTHFLKALLYYDYLAPEVQNNPVDTLLSVLKMSHKYEVSSLRKRILSQMSLLFPSTLAAASLSQSEKCAFINDRNEDFSVDVVLAARQVSMDWILPFVFYQMCRLSDESCILDSPLSMADKKRWIVGCRRLETAEMTRMLQFLWDPIPIASCTRDNGLCDGVRVRLRQFAESRRHYNTEAAMRLPLEIVEPAYWTSLRKSVCVACLTEMETLYAAARTDFWARLPQIFDLPGWEELEKIRQDAFAPDVQWD
ncbi:BTB domain-containing protein [Mycena indigotica]|uniref:BTB domain-containing protein n=1 Tax=Mycena indigotica TaxID=2126181 RepID=A0A8H6RZ76_9AGAR|nr:BTB domain-containing protein [Mycena indigotica]KAF7289701.1 BTB domain-containing protein [Mycena indigotica]